jgi:hypothetical protein
LLPIRLPDLDLTRFGGEGCHLAIGFVKRWWTAVEAGVSCFGGTAPALVP